MRRRWVLGGVVVVVLGLVAALAVGAERRVGGVLDRVTGLGPDCTIADVRGGGQDVELTRDQAVEVSAAGASAVRRAWGTERARSEVTLAAGRTDLRLSRADAVPVTAALTGRARAALTCSSPSSPAEEPDRLDARGLTARAAGVRSDLLGAFGPQELGGYAPGGVTTGHMPGSAHYEGRAVDVFYRPMTPAQKRRGWAAAQYLVANAERLDVRTVIYDARIWTAWRAGEGWRTYDVDTTGRSRQVADVLLHRDHVHVDVAD